MLKRSLLIVFVMAVSSQLLAQTKTTENLQKTYSDALAFYFYNNTLRMLNQTDNKEFDELIRDIEKMKFLMITKSKDFGDAQYKKLITAYKSESFEEIMTSRFQGRHFDIFLKDKNGKTEGMVVTVNDSTSLYVLDIVGSIALDKVNTLFKTIDESTDIGQKLRDFAKKD